MNSSYIKIKTRWQQDKQRLIARLREKQQHDTLLGEIRKQNIEKEVQYCQDVSRQELISTSQRDNMLVACAIGCAIMNESEPQRILTRDRGIVDLVREICKKPETNFLVWGGERYSKPLKAYRVEITCDAKKEK